MTRRDIIKLSFLGFLGLFLPKCKKEEMSKSLYYGMVQQGNEAPAVIPTFILIGDSNADGRGNLGTTSGTKYMSEWATDIINADKTTVKIFDYESTDEFITLNKTNAQVNNASYTHGFEQMIGYGLAKHYGAQEVRIIKYGYGSTTAGGTGGLSWQPGENQMDVFEGIYADALAAAVAENVTLDLIACITWLGANDGENLTLANNFEANMTTVIEHLRDNVFEEQIPFILTDCPEGVTYKTTVRTAQTSLCGNVADCTDFNFHRFGSTVHPVEAGIFAGGLEIARTIIVDLLSGTDYKDDYIWSFQTARNGSYSIAMSINETIIGDYIDWGDGNSTLIDQRLGTYTHNYADASTKTVKIGLIVPWNIFLLNLNASATSDIAGTFNMEDLTGLDTFTTSNNNTGMTGITYPRDNYTYLVDMAPNLFVNCGLTSIDLTRFNCDGISINSNTSLTSIVDNSTSKTVSSAGNQFSSNTELTSLDIGCWVFTGPMYMRVNAKLTTFVHPSSTPTAMTSWRWCDENTILQSYTNYAQSIYATNFEFDNANLTTTQVDNLINEMWDRCQDTSFYSTSANKNVKLTGNNGYTGTFDAVTDWSGGQPTSPGAKAYDLLNDVTGTYNFATFSI